ncbi:inner membrane protein [Escherichia coli]|uniref:Inner membrane protein n=1 Tax=Escherichia coli TaxID=562 RepID=A0A2X1KHY6_ECOLX|nr:inner membrane protein [Escherichia coli]
MIKTTLLFFATALCEIIGCFLPWLWLKRNASIWLLLPAGDFTGAVCLVVNVASSGEWACLRGLWWRLCLHGVDVAARCGWRETDSL